MSAKRQRKRIEKRRRRRLEQGGPSAPTGDFRSAARVKPLAYTRRQAAEALGISLATLDRRIVPALSTVKMPSGMRLIPVSELERFLVEHAQVALVEFAPRRRAGRRPAVPAAVVGRIQRERAEGRSLGEIAGGLTKDGVPPGHGGRRWWPSTVRDLLLRTAPKA